MSKQFLEGYGGQTLQQLIAMRADYRIDSLVLAVEEAVDKKNEADLSDAERVVLAVAALEREVNNGGYDQFFTNSSCKYASFIVQALNMIGCPKVAAITADAIRELNLEHLEASAVSEAAYNASDDIVANLRKCDSRYYQNDESIEQQLFAYIERQADEIQVAGAR